MLASSRLLRILIFVGSLDLSRSQPSLQIDQVIEFEEAPRHLGTCLELLVEDGGGESDDEREARVRALHGTLETAASQSCEGRRVTPLLRVDVKRSRVTMRTRGVTVVPTGELVEALGTILGDGCVRVVGGHVPPAPPRPQRGRPRRFD